MIIAFIIFLSLVLILLLTDWHAVGRKVPFIGRLVRRFQEGANRPARLPSRPSPVRQSEAVPSAEDSSAFLADAVVKPEPAVQPVSANPEVQELMEKADVHFRKGELKAAENFYLQAAAKDPKCSKAYSRLGVIYLETGEDLQDAEAAFRQALKFDKENGFVLNNLGLVLYHQDKFADAIRQFELAVRQDEANANRHANLGKAYMAMRQYAKAESSFKKALKLAPNELEYKDLLAEAIEKKQAHKAMIRR